MTKMSGIPDTIQGVFARLQLAAVSRFTVEKAKLAGIDTT